MMESRSLWYSEGGQLNRREKQEGRGGRGGGGEGRRRGGEEGGRGGGRGGREGKEGRGEEIQYSREHLHLYIPLLLIGLFAVQNLMDRVHSSPE